MNQQAFNPKNSVQYLAQKFENLVLSKKMRRMKNYAKDILCFDRPRGELMQQTYSVLVEDTDDETSFGVDPSGQRKDSERSLDRFKLWIDPVSMARVLDKKTGDRILHKTGYFNKAYFDKDDIVPDDEVNNEREFQTFAIPRANLEKKDCKRRAKSLPPSKESAPVWRYARNNPGKGREIPPSGQTPPKLPPKPNSFKKPNLPVTKKTDDDYLRPIVPQRTASLLKTPERRRSRSLPSPPVESTLHETIPQNNGTSCYFSKNLHSSSNQFPGDGKKSSNNNGKGKQNLPSCVRKLEYEQPILSYVDDPQIDWSSLRKYDDSTFLDKKAPKSKYPRDISTTSSDPSLLRGSDVAHVSMENTRGRSGPIGPTLSIPGCYEFPGKDSSTSGFPFQKLPNDSDDDGESPLLTPEYTYETSTSWKYYIARYEQVLCDCNISPVEVAQATISNSLMEASDLQDDTPSLMTQLCKDSSEPPYKYRKRTEHDPPVYLAYSNPLTDGVIVESFYVDNVTKEIVVRDIIPSQCWSDFMVKSMEDTSKAVSEDFVVYRFKMSHSCFFDIIEHENLKCGLGDLEKIINFVKIHSI